MEVDLFSLPSQKEKLINFTGFTTAIMMLEATVRNKIHTGPADHGSSGNHTSNEQCCVLGETEDNTVCNSYFCRFSDLWLELMWYSQSNTQFLQYNIDTKPYSLTVSWPQFILMQYSGLWLLRGEWGCDWCFQEHTLLYVFPSYFLFNCISTVNRKGNHGVCI